MASSLRMLLLLGISLIAFAANEQTAQVDMMVAITEMEEAGYYTFVTLLQMLQDKIPSNVTFLMPSDRTLARTLVKENAISEFVWGHMIPMPLFFGHLRHFPPGSMIPTYYAGHMLKVTNPNGMVFLNGVQVVHPNVCTAGFSIRCHGINGVLVASAQGRRSSTSHPPKLKPTPATRTEESPPTISPPPPLRPPPTAPSSTTQNGALPPASRTPAGPKSAASPLTTSLAHDFVPFISCAVTWLFVV